MVHALLELYNNVHMYVVYKMNHPFFEQFKVNSEPWPWNENYKEWMIFLRKSIILVSINSLIVLPLALTFRGWTINWEFKQQLDMDKIPDALTLFFQIVFFFVVEDFFFHISHRFMHWRYIYPYFHKKHHEYRVTISLAAEYSHPLDFLISSLIPTTLGIAILGTRVHLFTHLCWLIVRMAETADGHSGYDFPWSPFRWVPLSTSATYHDYHHLQNVGNYSSVFRTWDTLFGQNKSYYKFIAAEHSQNNAKKQD